MILSVFLSLIFVGQNLYAQHNSKLIKPRKTQDGEVVLINVGIDNLGYWLDLAEKGVIPYNSNVKAKSAIYKGSKINSSYTDYEDSPDVVIVAGDGHTQSEVSIFIDPNDSQHVLNSNNSAEWTGTTTGGLLGADALFTSDGGETWDGQIEGTDGNYCDPAAGINLDGRMFVGAIENSAMQQSVAYSDDDGETWTNITVGSASDDKNHLWIDNSSTSPYEGNIYSAWTDFGSSPERVEIVHSSNDGISWSSPIEISDSPFDHGVHIQTDADGNVYVVWAQYNSWPTPEDAIGMSISTDGGQSFSDVDDIISNIKGIRNDEPLNHRVNSFPVMAINQQSGDLYVVWANYGIPGSNIGNFVNVYMIKSTNQGSTWGTPVQVSQSPNTNGTYSYLPWITCDAATGNLSVIFYDNRNVSGNDVEAWTAVSLDGGDTWEDFRISDVSFTTQAIPGLADGYMGDYLGITSLNDMVYPVWSDNRSGNFLAYTSPFSLNNRTRPTNFVAEITDDISGITELNWDFETNKALVEFNIYRDGELIGNTGATTFADLLPSFGEHKYQVSAQHDDGESAKMSDYVTWGRALIEVSPESFSVSLAPDQTIVKNLSITNNGQLDLVFDLKTAITNKYAGNRVYCSASGGGDEYISGVVFGDINNTGTGEDDYQDYTAMSTDVIAGETYPITISNGNSYPTDDLGIWVDFNQDGDFTDANENVICTGGDGAQGTYNITIPDDALKGTTTMRIRIKYNGSDCGSPCGSVTYGEVEDYSLNIGGWIKATVDVDTITPGETITIPVTFDATDYTVGTYNAIMHVYSNAYNNDTVDVPVTMTVVDDLPLTSVPTAIPEYICSGSASTLYANPVGGEGTYTFSWTDGDSYSSTDQNPVVNPTETTTYSVTVDDGTNTISNQVTVFVISDLIAPATPTGLTTIGNENVVGQYETTGSENAYSYEWSVLPAEAGEIVGISEIAFFNPADDYVGTANIKVKAINDCGESDWSDEFQVEVIAGSTSIITNEMTIVVYPNPSDGKFIFTLDSQLDDYLNIQIYNIAGQVVFSNLNLHVNSHNTMEIDLTDQPNGIYIINVSNNNINENLKIIVE